MTVAVVNVPGPIKAAATIAPGPNLKAIDYSKLEVAIKIVKHRLWRADRTHYGVVNETFLRH